MNYLLAITALVSLALWLRERRKRLAAQRSSRHWLNKLEAQQLSNKLMGEKVRHLAHRCHEVEGMTLAQLERMPKPFIVEPMAKDQLKDVDALAEAQSFFEGVQS